MDRDERLDRLEEALADFMEGIRSSVFTGFRFGDPHEVLDARQRVLSFVEAVRSERSSGS